MELEFNSEESLLAGLKAVEDNYNRLVNSSTIKLDGMILDFAFTFPVRLDGGKIIPSDAETMRRICREHARLEKGEDGIERMIIPSRMNFDND